MGSSSVAAGRPRTERDAEREAPRPCDGGREAGHSERGRRRSRTLSPASVLRAERTGKRAFRSTILRIRETGRTRLNELNRAPAQCARARWCLRAVVRDAVRPVRDLGRNDFRKHVRAREYAERAARASWRRGDE
jgi:hypothetical protein